MEAHNFNILESKIKQAIDEIVSLKKENADLHAKLSDPSIAEDSGIKGMESDQKTELLNKVDEMLQVLDQI